MKSKSLVLLPLLLLLAGCNFQAPLTDNPTRGVDPALLGSWFSLEDGSPLDIYRLSKDEYMVIDGGNPYVCTHSDLAGTSFVSCKQIQNDKESYGKYAYIAYKLENGILTVFTLSDSLPIKDSLSSAQIRQIVEDAAKSGSALDTRPGQAKQYKLKAN